MELKITVEVVSAFNKEITIATDVGEIVKFTCSAELANLLIPTIVSGQSLWNDKELSVEIVSQSHLRAFLKGA